VTGTVAEGEHTKELAQGNGTSFFNILNFEQFKKAFFVMVFSFFSFLKKC
jgi:hypothetical protein